MKPVYITFRLFTVFNPMGLIRLWLLLFYFQGYSGSEENDEHYFIRRSTQDMKSPSFIYEPPNKVEFSNGTGAVIICKADGNPPPSIRWETENGEPIGDVLNLRTLRADGSLVITPFKAEDYRPDIHSSVCICIASNVYGTIASRHVHLKGVVIQNFVIEVYDEYIVTGNTATFKCNIPSFVKDYLTIIEWIEEPTGRVIKPTATFMIKLSNSKDNRYFMLPSGELYIKQADISLNHRSYKCRAKHRLTEQIFTSSSSGRLIITESHNVISPRISDINPVINLVERSNVAFTCTAQGYPLPSYNWYKKESNQSTFLAINDDRFLQFNDILIIQNVNINDNGVYMCHVNNSAGEEKAETRLIVRAPLYAKLVPSHEFVEVGSSILLNCSVTGYPIDLIVWKKDNKPINIDSSDYGMRFLAKDLLHLESIRKRHRGMYQCFAYNDYESVQASSQLIIGDDPPEFRETFKSQLLKPGPALSLKCVAAGNPLPQITWTLDGFLIPEGLGVRFGDFVTKEGLVVSYVNISEVKIEDGGEYECKADNGVAIIRHSSRINVIGPPVVRPMKNMTVVAGEIFRITCPVSGYPIDEITWERTGQRLPYNHKQKVFENGTLEVHQVERSNEEGLYTCIAKNDKGQSSTSNVYVNIRVKPFIEPFSFPKSLREGQRASVLCTVSSGDYPIEVKWLKDNLPVININGVKVNRISHYSSTLMFESLALEHKGNYTCIASNEAGTTSHTALMITHVPPRWTIEPSDNSVVRGKSISVDCQAEGFPIPRIRWTKAEGNSPRDFKPIVSSPHLQVYENGSLTIQEARTSDSGYYLCQASNNVGSGPSKIVKITVNVAPYFKTKFSAEMVQKDSNVRIKCEAFGDKPISITWTKDKQKIYFNNEKSSNQITNYSIKVNNYQVVETLSNVGLISELLIDTTERSDSGLFSCFASNTFGYDDTNIQLIVQEPPDPPQDIHVIEISSRAIKLSWSPPYSGNSPITVYKILFKSAFSAIDQFENISIASESETIGLVNNLKPAQLYFLKMIAENRIGKSEPSKTIEVITEEEAPESPPLNVQAQAIDSKSIKVKWKPPKKEDQNGAISGYYIGYKPVSLNSPSSSFIYKTIQIDRKFKEEAVIRSLKRYTKYEIVVQAFNNKGASPSSEEVFVQTLEIDAPTTPQIHVTSTSAFSINLSWEPVIDDSSPIEGYLLYQRAHSKDFKSSDPWKEINLKGHQTYYVALNLACGTRYQFYLIAYNKVGKGADSEIVTVKTDGSVPVAPFHKSILTTNTTSATLHLSSWHDGGCPIINYSIKYRMKTKSDNKEWKIVPFDQSKPVDVEITGLTPNKPYQLLVTAENQVGSINAEYSFNSVIGSFPDSEIRSNFDVNGRTTNRALPSSVTLQLTDYSIMISIIASILVVVLITFLICILYRRLQYSSAAARAESIYSSSNGIKCNPIDSNTLPLQMLPSKMLRSFDGAATLPKVNYDTLRKNKCLSHHGEPEPMYATVKRTPRVPRGDPHIYSYPLSASPLISRLNSNGDPSVFTSETVNICNCDMKETETKLIDHSLCPLLDTL